MLDEQLGRRCLTPDDLALSRQRRRGRRSYNFDGLFEIMDQLHRLLSLYKLTTLRTTATQFLGHYRLHE